ncbi:Serine threonine protein phosphatase 2b catalytic subunit protein [Pleurostoma richardsiae]|uniref:Serine threonine protein phosphatase 2b catalytic subunit protein n=1 Tax=Pleurostoma richardsiae TaxID=41990 RepID=A0AA38R2I8_9PEZI|nr:Serine threonine protein phosphatase 2b catalytic subunit protein [Pleurostoma richardsiae]
MPPRFSLRPIAGRSRAFPRAIPESRSSVCLFCSLSAGPRKPRRRIVATRRFESTTTSASAAPDARLEVENALGELEKHAANYVNLSRVRLALSGLRQEPGKESIRVAILGLTDGTDSGRTAKDVVRLLLADPLTPEQDWEKQLTGHDATQPLIIRVGATQPGEEATPEVTKGGLLQEVNVSVPALNGQNLEILVAESNPLVDGEGGGAFQDFEEAVLVPTVDIPTSNTGRYTPITAPVHKALLVTDGIVGAASAISMPLVEYKKTIGAVVNLPGYIPEDASDYVFARIDTKAATTALNLFRESVGNAFEYEHLWFQSNVPALLEWLKSGVLSTSDGTTKEPVRELIASILRNALVEIQEEEARRLSAVLAAKTSSESVASLNKALAHWAESAHAELQDQLDLAFTGRRWRKLNWWKLFWRVDDVGMLSSEMLSQRFLPDSERSVIYLAGRIAEACAHGSAETPAYTAPSFASRDGSPSSPAASNTVVVARETTKWPTHIPFMRDYLQTQTVPALQALAQKLTLQSLSTSGLTSALGVLVYLSNYGVSEAGALAALGIVWSLRRLQKKWETAREYWEGEVREEGRKAVRAVEASVAEVLDKAASRGETVEGMDELRKTRELVEKADEALAKLK